jgi:hypothetical protein
MQALLIFLFCFVWLFFLHLPFAFFFFEYMERLFWIKKEVDIDLGTQTGQKFLGHEQIYLQKKLDPYNDFSWTTHN